MTRRQLNQAAKMIAALPMPDRRNAWKEVSWILANVCPNFDDDRFRKACKIEAEETHV